MRRLMTITLAVAALAVPVTLAACGGSESASTTSPATATAAAGTAAATFDQLFIDSMIPHHQQAIAMAQAAKDAGLSEPEVVEIADNIISSQQEEIDQMLEWRAAWFGSNQVDPNAGEELGMSMEEMGMAGDPDMFASSDDVDAMFATMTMDHHNGAIQMAEMAVGQAERPEIKELAQQIIDAQQAEIETLVAYASASDLGDMSGMDH